MYFEYQIMEFINSFHNNALNSFFIFITKLGDLMIIWIIITLLFFFIKKLSFKKDFLFITLVYFTSFVINNLLLKELFKRERPSISYEMLQPLINIPNSYSFPSGHAASSFVGATILSYYFPKYKIIFYSLAILIAFSRVYVGVHYPSDVIIGALIGFSVAKIGIMIRK